MPRITEVCFYSALQFEIRLKAAWVWTRGLTPLKKCSKNASPSSQGSCYIPQNINKYTKVKQKTKQHKKAVNQTNKKQDILTSKMQWPALKP